MNIQINLIRDCLRCAGMMNVYFQAMHVLHPNCHVQRQYLLFLQQTETQDFLALHPGDFPRPMQAQLCPEWRYLAAEDC